MKLDKTLYVYEETNDAIVVQDDNNGYIICRLIDGLAVIANIPHKGLANYAPNLTKATPIVAFQWEEKYPEEALLAWVQDTQPGSWYLNYQEDELMSIKKYTIEYTTRGLEELLK